MRTLAKTALLACAAAMLAFGLAACAGSPQPSGQPSSSESPTEVQAAEEQAVSREDVEPLLYAAAEKQFDNVTFSMKTETSATGASSDGVAQTQTVQTSTKGELDKSGEKPKVHMNYSASSSAELGKTAYEMFIDSSNLIVQQNGQLYIDAMSDEMLDSYANSITSAISKEEISSILDIASSFKVSESGGDTTVSVTVDKDKLVESELVDESSMPENSTIATMVVSYTVDPDEQFKSVRIMSSTSGTPTYRVSQSYEYSQFDETVMPDWPDMSSYVAGQSSILTDEDGNMYIIGEDGQTYYVTSIDSDGTVYFSSAASGLTEVESGGESVVYYYESVPAEGYEEATSPGVTGQGATVDPVTIDGAATDDASGDASGGDSSSDQGRAYITADDGTVHFLDEEGSRLFNNDDGTSYFIDADGNFYFLSNE